MSEKIEIWQGSKRAVHRRFLSLPKRLYSRDRLTQNLSTEKALLSGKHPLSGEFEGIPFVGVGADGRTVCRCYLTLYPDDSAAYVGFFESENHPDAVRLLMGSVERAAARRGKIRLIGPLNASFWIGYRFKTNLFDSVYTAEPYNREYYPKLWEDSGFSVYERYYSNGLRIPTQEDFSMKCRQRLERMQARGYTVKSPTRESFTRNLEEIYRLMSRIYSHFPTFRPIEWEPFLKMFGGLRYVLRYDMVRIVYKGENPVGFTVAIPNYQNLIHRRITPASYWKIRKIWRSPKEYVLLYMGIAPEEAGLGGAIAELIKQSMVERGLPSINALIHEGSVSGAFYRELTTRRYEYVLMEKPIRAGESSGEETEGKIWTGHGS